MLIEKRVIEAKTPQAMTALLGEKTANYEPQTRETAR
jgi:hypothetical protein